MTNTPAKTDSLCGEVLTFSRDTLLVSLRFLDAALSRLPFEPYGGTLATDGRHLFYDPIHILRLYKRERNLPTRCILHSVLHCVFQHICPPGECTAADGQGRRLWNLACDIASEYTISGLNLQAAQIQDQSRQEKVFKALLERIDMLTAEKIYKHFVKEPLDSETLAFYEDLFTADDHSMWKSDDELPAIWQNVSRRMQIDMETFTRQQEGASRALMQNLKEVNREVSDYDGFIRKFATRQDGMKLDPDEFDYTLYSYGMQISGGRAPLIEQVEYKESLRQRDIVLGIYAHDLLSADKVRLFLLNTWDILHSTESFYSRVRLHVLLPSKELIPDENGSYAQVLSTIEDNVITSAEEMRTFAEGLTTPDSHGNDFRPLFDKVAELKRKRAFRNLRGLLILTEDVGLFPSSMPAFPGAFIFVNTDYSTPQVPPWAIRLVLQEDEI